MNQTQQPQGYLDLQSALRYHRILTIPAENLEHNTRTKYIPPAAIELAGEVEANQRKLAHEFFISSEMGSAIEAANRDIDQLDVNRAALVRRVTSILERSKKLTPAFVEKFTNARNRAELLWEQAREESDFSIFKESFRTMVDLCQKKASFYGGDPWGALFEIYEPGMSVDTITQIMDGLQKDLVPFRNELIERSGQIDETILNGKFDVSTQKQLAIAIYRLLGFDDRRGRFDTVVHPCEISVAPDDVRITTRYEEDRFVQSMFGTMHEAGHGIFEQGRHPEMIWFNPPEGYSLGIHESQSRMFENLIGRSRSFWEYLFPFFCTYFPQFKEVGVEAFYRAINKVQPTMIRIRSDEITYQLHVILRFKIEYALMTGELKVEDVPDMWNSLCQEFFGQVPENDKEGCLQDTHWSSGLIGYFPTYLLGNIYGAQEWSYMESQIHDLDALLRQGNLAPIRDFLHTNIHQWGLAWEGSAFIEHLTGEPPTHKYLMDYFRQKFGDIYGISLTEPVKEAQN